MPARSPQRKLDLDPAVVRTARALARRAGRPVVRLAQTHTTVSVERAVLRLAGLTGADTEGIPWVNRLVDAVRADVGLEHGVALPAWDALRAGEHGDLTTLAQKAAAGSVSFRVPAKADATRACLAVGLVSLLVATSCRGSEDGEETALSTQWGPLAVAEFAGGDQALITGTIQITDKCVLLDERGESVLLVWPEDHTRWDDEETAVVFVGSAGERITLRDGEVATFSGGGTSLREGGTTVDDFLESIGWTSAPSRDCVVDSRWFIGGLVSHDESRAVVAVAVAAGSAWRRAGLATRVISQPRTGRAQVIDGR